MMDQCNHPLFIGRSCVHVKGHDGRHSHTWQQGDARYLDIDDKLIDMETGEVVGYTGDLAHKIIEEIVGKPFHRKPELDPDRQAKARRVLETQYGARFRDCGPVHAYPPTDGYRWHYEGTFKAFGTDRDGNDVEFDFHGGKVRRIYSLNQRTDAVAYARRFGVPAASRKFGIPAGTIYAWKDRKRAK
jgi:hypothetical protein